MQTIANETVNYGTYPFNRIQNQGSTNFTHNTAGGITQAGSSSFTYDINDNMLTAPNSSFSYDGAGNRRAKTVSGVNTRYVLSILGMSQVLMETNSSNAVQNYYVYGPTGLLYRVKSDNTTYSYYHYDYRGSTTAITNEAQNVTHSYSYDPFGKVLAKTEADANPFQYVGKYGVQYESPTLTFMRARYYDPTIGRFVSEDPVWHLNLYPYADNNPITRTDATGKDWRKDINNQLKSSSDLTLYGLHNAMLVKQGKQKLNVKEEFIMGMALSHLITRGKAEAYIRNNYYQISFSSSIFSENTKNNQKSNNGTYPNNFTLSNASYGSQINNNSDNIIFTDRGYQVSMDGKYYEYQEAAAYFTAQVVTYPGKLLNGGK